MTQTIQGPSSPDPVSHAPVLDDHPAKDAPLKNAEQDGTSRAAIRGFVYSLKPPNIIEDRILSHQYRENLIDLMETFLADREAAAAKTARIGALREVSDLIVHWSAFPMCAIVTVDAVRHETVALLLRISQLIDKEVGDGEPSAD